MYIVFGYYDHHNLGDEAYKTAIQKLLGDCIFSNAEDLSKGLSKDLSKDLSIDSVFNGEDHDLEKYSGFVFGGGDLINDYFHDRFKFLFSLPQMKIGLSIGIPYPDLINAGYLDHLDHVFVRNKKDLPLLEHRLGSEFIHYLPDVTFCLDIPEKKILNKKICGVFPSPGADIDIICKYINLIKNEYTILIYRFDTSKTDQDDLPMMKRIQRRIPSVILKRRKYKVREILEQISKLSIAICSRFHSHIFCTMLNVPFVSVSDTRKVLLFLEENDLMYCHASKTDHFPDNPDQLLVITEKNKFLLQTDQIKNLFLFNRKRIPEHKTSDQIYNNTLSLIKTKYNLDPEITILPPDIARILSQTISMEITNDPDSKYVYGTTENILNHLPIKEMIKWIMNDFQKISIFNHGFVNVDYVCQLKDSKIHRSGWNYVIAELQKNNDEKSVIVDTYLDRTFHWCEETMLINGIIPYTNRWIGFVHHTFLDWYSDFNCGEMIKKDSFQKSLETCLGIIVLSDHLNSKLSKHLDVPIYTLYHPTEIPEKKFCFSKFKGEVIQVGAWMRDCLAIFKLKTFMTKRALKGVNMESYFPPKKIYFSLVKPEKGVYVNMMSRDNQGSMFIRLLKRHLRKTGLKMDLFLCSEPKNLVKDRETEILEKEINDMISSVEIIERVSDNDYDKILEKSVVMIKLFDASAVNTVIECFVRNCPILINKLPAVVEILGENYPFYFNDLNHAGELLNYKNVLVAHNYLCGRNKDFLKLDYFIEKFKDIIKKL